MIDMIIEALGGAGIGCDTEKAQKLGAYLDALLEKNKSMNLTAITDPVEAVKLHLADSAACLSAVEMKEGARLIDVGTGGGLPGMVIAILRPDMRITLCDATQKKIDFLSETAAMLGLKNVSVLCGRAEELAQQPKFREKFDYAAARAVDALPQLLELSLPFVRVGGLFLAWKGQKAAEERAASKQACAILGGGRIIVRQGLEGTDRAVISVKKIKPTPQTYPRRYSLIKAKPL